MYEGRPFQPSRYSLPPSSSAYGWATAFPLSALTVSATAKAAGLSNQPATAQHASNLSLLSDFLAKLPFKFRVNSGYRAPNVNALVGGTSASQHMNGLGTDISPIGLTNEQLATWFYNFKDTFPELDQVIWYTDTSHVHIGICPPGGKGCVRGAPRGEFLKAQKEGSNYSPWAPTPTELAKQYALFASHRPLETAAALFGLYVASGVVVLGSFAAFLAIRKKRRRQLEQG